MLIEYQRCCIIEFRGQSTSFLIQGRNEVYGIRDQRPKKGWDQGSQPRIRDQSPRDRDQRVFHGLKDQASKFCGIRDQNFHHFWDQGLKICVKIRDQRRKNIPRYDPVNCAIINLHLSYFVCNSWLYRGIWKSLLNKKLDSTAFQNKYACLTIHKILNSFIYFEIYFFTDLTSF